MIVFYNKKTGEIIGTVNGRYHDDHVLNNFSITTSGIDPKDVEKYVVPFKVSQEIVQEPIFEARVVDLKTMRVENAIIGFREVEKIKELIPDVPDPQLIYDFENRKIDILDFKVKIDKDGNPMGFEHRDKKQKPF